MLVSVGRGPSSRSRPRVDRRRVRQAQGIAADEHRRTAVPHIYAVGDCAGYWQLAHTAFREERSPPRTPAADATVEARRSAPDLHRPEVASVGLTEAEAREQYGDDVAVGQFPWVANARAVMQNETVGWVKSIHETRYGELLGLVMVGPHVTDLIEAGVVALDAESTVETVADGMAAHPLERGSQGSRSRSAGPRDPPPEQKRAPAPGRAKRWGRAEACPTRRRRHRAAADEGYLKNLGFVPRGNGI